jgi:hypothetical protein
MRALLWLIQSFTVVFGGDAWDPNESASTEAGSAWDPNG